MDIYNKELCENNHKVILKKLENHEIRLNGHSARLDKLEQRWSVLDTKIDD